MSLSLILPINQDDIPSKVKEIKDELFRLDAERKQVGSLLKVIQDACSHPKTYSDGGGYGGPSFSTTYCEICGKGW